jgi:2-succinyl-5-enolpyruvyl-6-hydroxy-3-cyclohexene-1-carboxylate synthase
LQHHQKSWIAETWPSFGRVLVVAGQLDSDEKIKMPIKEFVRQHNVPIVGDVISNLHGGVNLIAHADLFLGNCSEEVLATLQPDLLITFGESTIAKQVKIFLRKHAATAHWHIQSAGDVADTYQSVTQVFRSSPDTFFQYLSSLQPSENLRQTRIAYAALWEKEETRICNILAEFLKHSNFGEVHFVNQVMRTLSFPCNLHLANSMSVRYASIAGLKSEQQFVEVFANRGTSGIDGCSSTCVGHCFSSSAQNILITGDLAFFYDRNAFWHNYAMPNLRIVLLNNHGGIIFKIIDGPTDAPETDEYFVTRQKLSAKHLCAEFGFEYLKIDDLTTATSTLKSFFDDSDTPKILEFESDLNANKKIFTDLKNKIKSSYEL